MIEAIRAGRRSVHEVRLPAAARTPGLRELERLLEERGIPAIRERPAAGGGNRVVARADPFPEEPFEALLDAESPRLLVALDGVTDVGNLGSIARSAEGAGASALVLEHRRAPPIDCGALRASAGALEHLRVGRTPSLPRALDLCIAEGLLVLAAEAEGVPLEALPPAALRGDLVWVFGSEDRGLREATRRRATHLVGLALAGRIASLGVAAAAAHLLLRTLEIRLAASD